ncbi:hypothetical protein G9A89_012093 [Geosiphon pyriformis]|nr:hypothetical protein G9A89_012093 [Geosiphon pyriformis]
MVVTSGGKLLGVVTATAVNCKKLPPPPPKLLSNTFGGPKNFKPSFVGSKSYAKTAVFVVPLSAATANMDLDLGGPPKTVTPIELSVLIKSLVKSVGALVALVIKLLSTPSAVDVSVKECVDKLAKQNKNLAAVAIIIQKRMTCLEKICEWTCLEDESDGDDMVDNVDDNDDEIKDFSVYDNTFDPFRIKFSPNQTAKWMSGMVKNSHELVSIMGKMYELDMFDILDSKDSTSM